MKKTLMTAVFAMASVSLTTADTDNILGTSVAGISDFQTSLTVDCGTSSSSVSVNKDDESGDVTLSFGEVFSPRNISVTLALDYNTLLSLATETPGGCFVKVAGSVDLGMGINTDSAFQGWWNSSFYSGGPTTGSLSEMSGNVSNNGLLLVTLVSGDNVVNTSAGTRFYIGEDVDTSFYSKSGLVGSCNYNSVTIGGAYADAVKEIYVFSSVLSQTDLKAVNSAILSVPEPATASLSLLALGALALRRRRA